MLFKDGVDAAGVDVGARGVIDHPLSMAPGVSEVERQTSSRYEYATRHHDYIVVRMHISVYPGDCVISDYLVTDIYCVTV